MQYLEPPPKYRLLVYGEKILASDLEGSPRNFIGWKQVRSSIIGEGFCSCWGIVVIRDE